MKFVNVEKINKLVDKLVEECSENIDENEMIYNGTLNDYEKVCNSSTINTVLFVIAFLIIIGISSAYFYFHSYLKKDIFFLSWFSFTDTYNSQDSIRRDGTFLYSFLPLPPAHEHSDIYLQPCM